MVVQKLFEKKWGWGHDLPQHTHALPRCGKSCPVIDKQRKQTALPGWTPLDDANFKPFLRRRSLRKTKETRQKQRLSWASYKLKTKEPEIKEKEEDPPPHTHTHCGHISIQCGSSLSPRSLQCQGGAFNLCADKRHCR